MKFLCKVNASLHIELMLNFTDVGKEAEMLLLRFVLIIFLHATK